MPRLTPAGLPHKTGLRWFSRPEIARPPDHDVHRVLDLVERAAEQARWLEREEPELLSALSGSRVG